MQSQPSLSQIPSMGKDRHAPGVTDGRYKGYYAALRRCPGCGEFFTYYRGLNDCKKHCSHRCVQRCWRQRNPRPQKIVDHSYGFFTGQCPGCGKDVWASNPQQIYCPGSKCRTAAYRARKAAAIEVTIKSSRLTL